MENADEIQGQWLVLRAQDRDPDALDELVSRWQPRLLRHALRLTGEEEAAGEVLQEAWLAIVRGLRRLDDPARFPAWAYRIVTNKCADWVRRSVQRRAAARPLNEEPAAPEPPDAGPEAEIAALRRALRQLEPERRAVLSMFYLDEMSVRQIAEALGLPEGTVKSRLHHARNHLKQILERNEP